MAISMSRPALLKRDPPASNFVICQSFPSSSTPSFFLSYITVLIFKSCLFEAIRPAPTVSVHNFEAYYLRYFYEYKIYQFLQLINCTPILDFYERILHIIYLGIRYSDYFNVFYQLPITCSNYFLS